MSANERSHTTVGTTAFKISGSRPLRGELQVPGDKSISHRALMLGAIAAGSTRIVGLLEGEDCLHTATALRALGVSISSEGPPERRIWTVHGVGPEGLKVAADSLDMGNSGTGMRLLSGLLAGQGVTATLIGDGSLMQRPMERIAAPLRQMGADIRTLNRCPPIGIVAANELHGIEYDAPVSSAQVKSAILLAGLGATGPTTVREPVQSRDHTERMLPTFGCPVSVEGTSVTLTGPAPLHAAEITVPGDISSAAFFIVAASIIADSDISLTNVGVNPTRIGVLRILEAMGADLQMNNRRTINGEPVCDLRVRAAQLTGIDVPPEWVPSAIDEFPIVFIAAAVSQGITRVSGAGELKVKESDRLGAMATGLRTLGVEVTETGDGLEIAGGPLGGGEIDSFDDHRIAMAFAIAGGRAEHEVIVNNVDNVATSFPGFPVLAQAAGLEIQHVKWPGR